MFPDLGAVSEIELEIVARLLKSTDTVTTTYQINDSSIRHKLILFQAPLEWTTSAGVLSVTPSSVTVAQEDVKPVITYTLTEGLNNGSVTITVPETFSTAFLTSDPTTLKAGVTVKLIEGNSETTLTSNVSSTTTFAFTNLTAQVGAQIVITGIEASFPNTITFDTEYNFVATSNDSNKLGSEDAEFSISVPTTAAGSLSTTLSGLASGVALSATAAERQIIYTLGESFTSGTVVFRIEQSVVSNSGFVVTGFTIQSRTSSSGTLSTIASSSVVTNTVGDFAVITVSDLTLVSGGQIVITLPQASAPDAETYSIDAVGTNRGKLSEETLTRSIEVAATPPA